MTGDRDCEVVRRAGTCDGAHRLRRPDAPSDFGVGNRFAGAKVLQRQPDPPLECGAAQIERKVQADLRPFDEGDDPRYQGLVVAIGPDQPRVREAILEAADERLRIVSEQDRGHALLARGHQKGAERRLADGEPQLLVAAAGAVFGRRHAQHAGRLLVEAAAGVEAGVIDRLGHGVAASQSAADLPGPVAAGILLRRQARRRLEQAMEVARTAPDRRRQIGERRFFLARLDDPAGPRDQGRVLAVLRKAVGIAALAGPEARRPGALQRVVEPDVPGIGHARRAGRPAIDARRFHRVPQVAVGRSVTGNDPRPAGIVRD